MENTKITQNEQKSNEKQLKSDEIVITKEYLDKKIDYYQKIIQRTINSSLKYKNLTILGASEINVCISSLEQFFSDLTQLQSDVNKYYKS